MYGTRPTKGNAGTRSLVFPTRISGNVYLIRTRLGSSSAANVGRFCAGSLGLLVRCRRPGGSPSFRVVYRRSVRAGLLDCSIPQSAERKSIAAPRKTK
jgi:hypothetical protein